MNIESHAISIVAIAILGFSDRADAQSPPPELTPTADPAAAPPPPLPDETATPPSPALPMDSDAATPPPGCGATSCSSLATCEFTDEGDNDVLCYAHFAWEAEWACTTAVEKPPKPLTAREKKVISKYFQQQDPDAICTTPAPIVRGAFDASIIKGPPGLWGQRWAVQILPTFSLGIPFGFDSNRSVAHALSGITTIGGLVIRATPVSHYFSAHALLGTASVKTDRLDPDEFTDPRIIMLGGGVDALGGLIGVTYVWAQLRKDGLFGATDGSDRFVNVSFDLTAIGLTAAGLVGGE